jgi:hypothetical protein
MLAVGVLVVPSNYWGEQLKIDCDRLFPPRAQLVEIIAGWKSCKLSTSIKLLFIQQNNYPLCDNSCKDSLMMAVCGVPKRV